MHSPVRRWRLTEWVGHISMDTNAYDWFGHVRVRIDTQLSVRGVHSRCSQEEPSVGGVIIIIIWGGEIWECVSASQNVWLYAHLFYMAKLKTAIVEVM